MQLTWSYWSNPTPGSYVDKCVELSQCTKIAWSNIFKFVIALKKGTVMYAGMGSQSSFISLRNAYSYKRFQLSKSNKASFRDTSMKRRKNYLDDKWVASDNGRRSTPQTGDHFWRFVHQARIECSAFRLPNVEDDNKSLVFLYPSILQR